MRNMFRWTAAAAALCALALPVRAASFDAPGVLDQVQALAGPGFDASAARLKAPPVGAPVGIPAPARTRKPSRPAPRPAPGTTTPGTPSQPGSSQPPMQGQAKPDFSFTPGRLCSSQDPDFKEFRGPQHIAICNRNVTEQMKEQVAARYGIPKSEWQNYEFDHLLPLEIGGDSYIDNLWPQPIAQAKMKDQLENELGGALNAGTMTQDEAVRRIYAWFGVAEPNMPTPTTVPHRP